MPNLNTPTWVAQGAAGHVNQGFSGPFFERFARSVPHFLKGAAPVLPRPTRRFERDARLNPQILKGMAKLAASLC
jgi:hypothetical protein